MTSADHASALAGALAGFKVIDLTRVVGGPFCTQLLGDHGAEVIKVEPPQGDETRSFGPPFQDGDAAYFHGLNRNKRSISLDLSRAGGRDVLLRLLEGADVLIENFKTGTLERWGLGYEEVLKPRFPGLIHCRITGFGDDGPLGGFPGYDAVAQALTGLISVNGTPETGPLRIGVPIVDLATGLMAAIAILLAVEERHRSNRGQLVETTLFDTGVSLLHPHAANWLASAKPPRLTGNAHSNVVPYDQYSTATGRIFLGVGNERQFGRLCAELGEPGLAHDPRFRANADRVANRVELTAELTRLLADKDGEALCLRLLERGVPAGPVLDVPQVLDHPHTRHRRMVIDAGAYRGTGIPIKLARTPGAVRAPPPRFAASGREILAEAGFSDHEIETLAQAGVLIEEPKPLA